MSRVLEGTSPTKTAASASGSNSAAGSIASILSEKLARDLLLVSAALMGFAWICWLLGNRLMGNNVSATIPLAYEIVLAITVAIYLKSNNFAFFRYCQLALFLFTPFAVQWAMGDVVTSSGVMLWAIMAPIGALVFHGQRESLPWIVAYLLLAGMSGFFDIQLARIKIQSAAEIKTIVIFFVLNFVAISTIVYFLVQHFVREMAASRAIVEREQERSERLLLNVLPQRIAERLKRDEQTIADGFADVSVVFADIVGFTKLSEEMSPSQIVTLLNQIFSAFDELAEKHGLEKIKTIGDAYMVAGGLGSNTSDYVAGAAEMAFDMQAVLAQMPPVRGRNLELRIGIATGPAVAGVIGTRKFIYDLWGDTVNIASRIHGDSPPGAIQVDVTTYKRLYTRYPLSEPQIISVKGKGELSIYRLLGRESA
jgi:adenylate cyclase